MNKKQTIIIIGISIMLSLLESGVYAYFGHTIIMQLLLFISNTFGNIGLAGMFILFLLVNIISIFIKLIVAFLTSRFLFSTKRIQYFFITLLFIIATQIFLNMFGITSKVSKKASNASQPGKLQKIEETYQTDATGLPHLYITLSLLNTSDTLLSGTLEAGSSFPHIGTFYCEPKPKQVYIEPGKVENIALDCTTQGSGDINNYVEIYKKLPPQLPFQLTVYTNANKNNPIFTFETNKRNWTDF